MIVDMNSLLEICFKNKVILVGVKFQVGLKEMFCKIKLNLIIINLINIIKVNMELRIIQI